MIRDSAAFFVVLAVCMICAVAVVLSVLGFLVWFIAIARDLRLP